MICPYCNHGINFEPDGNSQVYPSSDYVDSGIGYQMKYGFCPLCDEFLVLLYFGQCSQERIANEFYYSMDVISSESFLYPKNFVRPVEPEVPAAYKTDFIEACNVLNLSPKASAALSRRLLQNVLREHFKIQHRDLANEIDEFIKIK